MFLDLMPCEYSKSGNSLRFTSNGFQQYWIKVSQLLIDIQISEYEDWDNKYRVTFDENDLFKYGNNYFRINKVIDCYKL